MTIGYIYKTLHLFTEGVVLQMVSWILPFQNNQNLCQFRRLFFLNKASWQAPTIFYCYDSLGSPRFFWVPPDVVFLGLVGLRWGIIGCCHAFKS